MPNTQKNHDHGHDSSKKRMGTEDEKMKSGKSAMHKGENGKTKPGEMPHSGKEGNGSK